MVPTDNFLPREVQMLERERADEFAGAIDALLTMGVDNDRARI